MKGVFFAAAGDATEWELSRREARAVHEVSLFLQHGSYPEHFTILSKLDVARNNRRDAHEGMRRRPRWLVG